MHKLNMKNHLKNFSIIIFLSKFSQIISINYSFQRYLQLKIMRMI